MYSNTNEEYEYPEVEIETTTPVEEINPYKVVVPQVQPQPKA